MAELLGLKGGAAAEVLQRRTHCDAQSSLAPAVCVRAVRQHQTLVSGLLPCGEGLVHCTLLHLSRAMRGNISINHTSQDKAAPVIGLLSAY